MADELFWRGAPAPVLLCVVVFYRAVRPVLFLILDLSLIMDCYRSKIKQHYRNLFSPIYRLAFIYIYTHKHIERGNEKTFGVALA